MASENKIFDSDGFYRTALTSEEQIRVHCSDLPAGLVVAQSALPPGMLIVKNFLAADICRRIVDYADRQKGEASTVGELGESSDNGYVSRLSTGRVTQYIDMHGIRDEVVPLVANVFKHEVEPFYRVIIEWFEYPEILRYLSGGYYWPHADADNWSKSEKRWVRSLDRDYSILIYLNDDYTGGEIVFPNFRLRLSPEAGMLVAFPSDHRYLHAARPTESGQRYVVVSWAAKKNGERITNRPPTGAIALRGMPASD